VPVRKLDKAEWHVSINDVPIGPIRLEEMAHKVDAGAVSEYSLVWRDGFDEWRPLATVPELMSLLYERRSSGPPARSRLSSMPPFVEAQTAIKETPEPPSIPPAAPTPPVHALVDSAGASPSTGGALQGPAAAPPGEELFPLADTLQPEPSLTASFEDLTGPPQAMAEVDPQPLPGPESASPLSGLPESADEPASAPPAASQPEPQPSQGTSPWIWVLLVAVAVFAGVAAVMVVDRWGDEIMERVLDAIDGPTRSTPAKAPAAPEPAEPVETAIEPTEAEPFEGGAEGVEVTALESDEEGAEASESETVADEPNVEETEAVEDAEPTKVDDGAQAPPSRPRRRARARRPSRPSPAPAEGIKKLRDDGLSAEEQKLLADFGSSGQAGVAKIDVKEAKSASSKRDPLDNEAVSSTVTVNKPRLQRCYERAIRGQQSPTAVRMNVSLTVAPSGRVSSVDVTGSGPGGLRECMEASIRRWRFPASSEGGPAKFPIVFSAN